MSWPDSDTGSHGPGGQSFCEPLWLPGWSERSIWGFDQPTGSYFAQLWPDGDRGDAPTIWIGASGSVTTRSCLVAEVAGATQLGAAVTATAFRGSSQ